jgi:hypothetical protein
MIWVDGAEDHIADVAVTKIDLREIQASHPLRLPPRGLVWQLGLSARGVTKGLDEAAETITKTPAVGDDLLRPGPWAKGSAPSSAPGKIKRAERDVLNPIGDRERCHSCGALTSGTKSGTGSATTNRCHERSPRGAASPLPSQSGLQQCAGPLDHQSHPARTVVNPFNDHEVLEQC